jgi:hypothetical protein
MMPAYVQAPSMAVEERDDEVLRRYAPHVKQGCITRCMKPAPTIELKIHPFGNSLGVVLPKDVTNRPRAGATRSM